MIAAGDGGSFEGTLVLPDTARGPGVLLLQEIFGVGDFLLAKADELAGLGYVVLCPDVFWRVEPGVSLAHDDAALARGMGLAGRYASEIPEDTRVGDLLAALDHLRALDEVSGPTAVVGYCLGGFLAYLAAARGAPDACVSYYGSGVAARLDEAARITCPTLFHFGGSDPYVPIADVEAVAAAFAGRPDVEVHVQPDAGHAFENLFAPAFADPDAAARSWPVTVGFLKERLG